MKCWLVVSALLLSACATDTHIPPFARIPFEPFSRDAVVAIALREWRAFGSLTEPVHTEGKAERQEGLWQRVGEYWWLGLDPSDPEAARTGKHDARGRVFPPDMDGDYAWSAAFISYVMRIAGAGKGFPYAASHYVYIHAAMRPDSSGLVVAAERPDAYAPRPGDLICAGRGADAGLTFDSIAATPTFAGHCDIVVETGGPEGLSVIGGNVSDAVTMKHVPVTQDGRLAPSGQPALDPDIKWMVILRLRDAPTPIS